MLPNVQHFTNEFDIEGVNEHAQHAASFALQSSSDIIISTSFDARLYILVPDRDIFCSHRSLSEIAQTEHRLHLYLAIKRH